MQTLESQLAQTRIAGLQLAVFLFALRGNGKPKLLLCSINAGRVWLQHIQTVAINPHHFPITGNMPFRLTIQ